MWTLITYTEVKYPLSPYTSQYTLGVVENDEGERRIVHLEETNTPHTIRIGTKGDVRLMTGSEESFFCFFPYAATLDHNKEIKNVKKVALITGSARGIGRAIAFELARKGFSVIINNNTNEEEGRCTATEIQQAGGEAIYLQADVSKKEEAERIIMKIQELQGRLDVLVNNAGITLDKRFENMTSYQWHKVIDVNLHSSFYCTKSALKIMQQQKSGRVIFITSIIGQIGNIGQANYATTKGGIIALTKTLAKEYARENILINAVAPGFITTKMTENIPKGALTSLKHQIPLGRLGTPEEVAKTVAFLVSDDAGYITGQVLHVNGGLYV